MNLALTVLDIIAPVFHLGAAGFTWMRVGYAYPTQVVTRLAKTSPLLAIVALPITLSFLLPG